MASLFQFAHCRADVANVAFAAEESAAGLAWATEASAHHWVLSGRGTACYQARWMWTQRSSAQPDESTKTLRTARRMHDAQALESDRARLDSATVATRTDARIGEQSGVGRL
jgi:hypothetical protein